MRYSTYQEFISTDPAVGLDNRPWLAAILIMAAVIVLSALLTGIYTGIPAISITGQYALKVLVLTPVTLPLLLLGWVVKCAIRREPNPLGELKRLLSHRLANRASTASIVVPLLLVPLVMGAFGTLKQAIPLVSDFVWDDRFAEAGRLLFLGNTPWKITHAVLGDPLSTAILDRIYTLWVPLLFLVVLSVALSAQPRLRARFFLSFIASWLIIASLGAWLFASAGPCYAGEIGAANADYFEPLMARLHAINAHSYPLGAVEWQRVLWEAHVSQDYGFAMGISAMPSMHNAICFLYVLAAWNSGWVWRSMSIAFALAIVVGSVHLGWHYAVDAFGAWALMGLIWWLAGLFLRRWCDIGGGAPRLTPNAEQAS